MPCPTQAWLLRWLRAALSLSPAIGNAGHYHTTFDESRLRVVLPRPVGKQQAHRPQLPRPTFGPRREPQRADIDSAAVVASSGVEWRATADEDGHYSFAVPL